MADFIEPLKVALADTFVFGLKAQFYHWNVQGPNFKQYHDLFGLIYEDANDAIDPLAEFIRASGSYAPGTLSRFKELTTLVELNTIPDAKTMIMNLSLDNDKVIMTIKTAYEAADNAGAYDVSDFLAARLASHKKHGWFLQSTIGNNVKE
jgi:starvation-inducible DNA-binding protein